MESFLQHFASQLPATFWSYVLQITAGLILAVVFGSFIEHCVHQFAMHRGLHLFGERKLLKQVHHSHAELHHGTFYKRFDHEDDPIGREESIVFTATEIALFQVTFLPGFLLIAWFSPVAAVCFSAVAFFHNHLWNIIHREMHQPKHPSWVTWSAYRFLARHHFLHHRHQGTNFNIVLPLADYVLRTAASATPEDKEEMHRMGYLAQRS